MRRKAARSCVALFALAQLASCGLHPAYVQNAAPVPFFTNEGETMASAQFTTGALLDLQLAHAFSNRFFVFGAGHAHPFGTSSFVNESYLAEGGLGYFLPPRGKMRLEFLASAGYGMTRSDGEIDYTGMLSSAGRGANTMSDFGDFGPKYTHRRVAADYWRGSGQVNFGSASKEIEWGIALRYSYIGATASSILEYSNSTGATRQVDASREGSFTEPQLFIRLGEGALKTEVRCGFSVSDGTMTPLGSFVGLGVMYRSQ